MCAMGQCLRLEAAFKSGFYSVFGSKCYLGFFCPMERIALPLFVIYEKLISENVEMSNDNI